MEWYVSVEHVVIEMESAKNENIGVLNTSVSSGIHYTNKCIQPQHIPNDTDTDRQTHMHIITPT